MSNVEDFYFLLKKLLKCY